MEKFRLGESLSIVIPAFNEGGNLRNLVEDTLRDVKQVTSDFEIIIVNDGSSDDTGAVADSLSKKYKNVHAFHQERNKGLALAWRRGIAACRKDVILYIEGDGQQPFKDQIDLLRKIKNADLVLGVRTHRFDYTPFRKLLSYGFLFLIRVLFGLWYKDVGWSQAYRRKIFDKIEMKSVTPFFDTEVIIKALRNGFTVTQAASFYRPRKAGSTSLGNIKTAWIMFEEMLKMRLGLLD